MLPSTETFYDDKAHPGCLYKHHTRWLKILPQIEEYSVVFLKKDEMDSFSDLVSFRISSLLRELVVTRRKYKTI